MKEYVMAVDVARKHDYFNIQVGRISPEITPGSVVLGTSDRVVHYLDIIHIEKYQNIGYDEAVGKVARLAGHRDLVSNCDIIVDATGIGDAAVELMRKRNLNPIPILFTSGTAVREVTGESKRPFRLTPGNPGFGHLAVLEEIHVPKEDLKDAGVLLTQQRRVRVAESLRWADDFKRQLNGFRGEINKTGRKSYNAETDSLHDDQVVCFLMMAWWMGRMTRQVKVEDGHLIRAEERLAAGSPYLEAGE